MASPMGTIKVTGPVNLTSEQVIAQSFMVGDMQTSLVIYGPMILDSGNSLSATFNLTAAFVPFGFRDILSTIML